MAIPRNTSSAMAIFILLLVFISELLWSTSEALTKECHVPEVTDGQTGMMVFFIDRRVNFSSDHFFANLIRSDEPDWDILNCDQPNRTSHVSCKINSPIYKCRGVRDHKLTVFIPNITQHYADTYVFQVYINSIAQPPVFCSVSVKKQLKPHINTVIKTESTTTPWVIAGVIFLAIGSLTLVFFVVVCHRQRICGSSSNDDETSGPPLLNSNTDSTVDNYEDKRWYWSEDNEKGDKLLVNHFWKNGPGAFLVRPSTINKANFVLVASFDGTVQHLTLVKDGKGFKCPRTDASFNTLCQVVEHYKQNTITVSGRTWGKLLKPFAPAPEQDWYHGRLVTEYEENVLLSSGCRDGSFLIADAFTDADAYYLIVHFEGRVHRFGIAPNDDVLKMVDTDFSGKTLVDIVEHYKKIPIIPAGSSGFGKLSEPCPKKPDVQWFSETLTVDEEMKILQSRRNLPGSFLVSKGVTNPNKYFLAVYCADEIKRFTVKEESNGFKLQYSEMLFYSWYELVDYYKKHDIEIRGNNFGKLSTPLRKEPEESCYIGRKTRMEERDLLLAGTPASGDFLIRDGFTYPEVYVLAVNFHGQINHFDIFRENGGFMFCDTGKVCTTLGELVDFYKNNEITVGEKTFGKLGKLVMEVGR